MTAAAGDAAWTALLDRFEHDLDTDADATGDWHPPGTPLPPHLVERARTLVDRQAERMSLLHAELVDTRAHLAALDLVPPARTITAAYVERDA